MLRAALSVLYIVFTLLVFSNNKTIQQDQIIDSTKAWQWVDSIMVTLKSEEKIGQLFILRANYPDKPYNKKIVKYIKDYNIGGVTFFKGNVANQAFKTNEWQAASKIPLFISIDGEWGIGMRLTDVISFPFQMTLGAVCDDTLIYQMGKAIGEQCKRMGIQINFAPVVDINSNPANPIIGMRSFGENKDNVSTLGINYMKGLQDEGIIATAKHFPGHGDTDTDSHKTLPILQHDKERLDTLELYPFKKLIKAGVDGIMIAHLYIPAIEKRENIATTLSKAIVDSLLRKELGFEGLIITDALDMQGVKKYFSDGKIALAALEAGCDILLLSGNLPEAVKTIKKAVRQEKISQELIDEKCRKILFYKYKAGLNDYHPIDLDNLNEDLNDPKYIYLKREILENAITTVKNQDNLIPLKSLDTLNIASVSIGTDEISPFQKSLSLYSPVSFYQIAKAPKGNETVALLSLLKDKNLVILDVQHTSIFPFRNFGINDDVVKLINDISKKHTVILVLHNCPYILAKIPDNENIKAIIISYQDDEVAQDLAAQVVFGGIASTGKLPVSVSEKYPVNSGILTSKSRLEYTVPLELGIHEDVLLKVDSIAIEGITSKAYPGCQVIAAKDGKVFYNKSFGYHTYNKKTPVINSDIYDIASLTKIVATAPAVMKLDKEGKIDVDRKIGYYLHYLKGTNKESIIISEILTHQSGLKAWIPYYKYLIDEDILENDFFSDRISEEYPIRVAEGLYTSKDYFYIIFDSIKISTLRPAIDYRYSDIGFYLMAKIIEDITNQSFENYLSREFYKPLGLSTMGFLPRNNFSLDRLVPTENDKIFRKQLLQGDVHDQGAALLGGVSGHAGVFSDANDVAIIMQMFLDYGSYGDENILDSAIIKKYNKIQFPLSQNRRGLAFDKPFPEYQENGPVCESASPSSFGHSGFTGTYAWADPENNMIFVFLSNRIHPDASNTLIMERNIRTRIHQAFYDIINNINSNNYEK